MAENPEDYPKHPPHPQTNHISDVILGGQDGLVSILGLLLGLSAASNNKTIIIAGALATIIAETISMGAVAYTSMMAEKEHYLAMRKREKYEIEHFADQEKQEIIDIYQDKGFEGKLLNEIVDHITANKKLWVDTMMKEELELKKIENKDVYLYSFIVGISTMVGAFLPLIPYFFSRPAIATWLALIISIIILGGIGLYKAQVNLISKSKSAIEMIVIGMGAALAGYLVGLIFKK